MNCSNVVVTPDVSNFIGYGLSNVTIDSSYNGRMMNATQNVVAETKTSSFTIDPSVDIYYIDTTGGNIEITLLSPSDYQNQRYSFKRLTGGANTIKFMGVVDGVTNDATILTTQYSRISLHSFNGTYNKVS